MLVRSGFLLRHRAASVISAAACKGKSEHRRATRDEQSRQGLRSMPTDMSSSDFHEVPFRSGHSSSYSICEKSCDIKHPKAQICEGPSPASPKPQEGGHTGRECGRRRSKAKTRRAAQDGRRARDRLARGMRPRPATEASAHRSPSVPSQSPRQARRQRAQPRCRTPPDRRTTCPSHLTAQSQKAT